MTPTRTPEEWNQRNAKVIAEFRAGQGAVSRPSGNPVLLLGTTGAKSGLPRTNPLGFLAADDCLYIFASKGGSPTHPDWYLNLVANPSVTVEVGDEAYDAVAEPITGPDRDAIYAKHSALRPNFGDYQRATTRIIPVIALRRK